MKKLATLRQRATDLKTEATALLDKADKESEGILSAEAEKRYGEIEAELKTLAAEITSLEKQADRRRTLDAVITSAPTVPGVPRITSSERDPSRTGGFANLAEFAISVRNAQTGQGADARLAGMMAAPTGYMEGQGAAGEGYLVPAEFRDQIFELVMGDEDLLGAVDIEPTSSRQVDLIADESTPWGSTGVQANWRGEGSQMSASKAAQKGRSVPLHELYAFVLASDELLEDAPRLNDRLTRKAASAISWKASDAIMWGTGAGMPLGFMNAGSLVTVAKEGSQTADTLDDQNVLKMYSRLLVVPGDRPFWIANRDVVPQLAGMVIGNTPIWMPPNGLMDAPGGMLLGYPVRFSEHAKTLGDLGDIVLGSWKGYYAARRTAGAQFAQSMHLFFDYGMQAFRWTFRLGGQPHLSAAVSPANGSNTKSHFVALAERA
jgi:HK97 family phage major capsid protein